MCLNRSLPPPPEGDGGAALAALLSGNGIEVKNIKIPSTNTPNSKLESFWNVLSWNRKYVILCAICRAPGNFFAYSFSGRL